MKKSVFLFLLAFTIWACDNSGTNSVTVEGNPQTASAIEGNDSPVQATGVTQEQLDNLKPNANIPEGDFPVKKVNFAPEVSVFMVQKGQRVFDTKCISCHNVSGAGGIAVSFEAMFDRHDPAWVLNMIRNVQSEEFGGKEKKCPTRTSEGKLEFMEARDVLELIRSVSPLRGQ